MLCNNGGFVVAFGPRPLSGLVFLSGVPGFGSFRLCRVFGEIGSFFPPPKGIKLDEKFKPCVSTCCGVVMRLHPPTVSEEPVYAFVELLVVLVWVGSNDRGNQAKLETVMLFRVCQW